MKRKFALIITIVGSIGVLSTLISTALNNPNTPIISAVYTLKYFTVQSNLIVVIYFCILISLKLDQSEFFNKLIGGVIVYITVTFIVFVIFLQGTWHISGLTLFGSILNHYVTPILSVSYFIYYRRNYSFKFQDILFWLLYPLYYLVFLAIHGSVTRDYIYPFFDIQDVGLTNFYIMLGGMIVLFFILSIATIYIPKVNKKNVR